MPKRSFPRPVSLIGDQTSSQTRSQEPDGWALSVEAQAGLAAVIEARRDIRRFRPDPVPDELVTRVVEAGHAGPSVGHSQPWRFIVVTDAATRDTAAFYADRERLRQADLLTPDRRQRLLDLQLDGIREAPLGIVVACDRRVAHQGVLGRGTFPDADMWSCACAIENMWLTARAAGLGLGWVTLFEPAELAALLGLPSGVETLGWLCLGWPDERPPEPGLQRRAWSQRLPLSDVVLRERWPDSDAPPPPVSGLRAPEQHDVVAPRDAADELLTPPGSLGVLDSVVNRVHAVNPDVDGGTLIIVGSDHAVARRGVSAYDARVTFDVLTASQSGTSLGAATARSCGVTCLVVDAGCDTPVEGALRAPIAGVRGDLASQDAMSADEVSALREFGVELGRRVAADGVVAVGEVGVGNTTVAAALAAAALGLSASDVVGQGAGSDSAMVARKVDTVAAALGRIRDDASTTSAHLLARVGGGEFAVLMGIIEGAASARQIVVLDGFATCVAALLAVRDAPAISAFLVAGQQSREFGHARILTELGLEPLLQLRLRSGEGVGAALAAQLVLSGMRARRLTARTYEAASKVQTETRKSDVVL